MKTWVQIVGIAGTTLVISSLVTVAVMRRVETPPVVIPQHVVCYPTAPAAAQGKNGDAVYVPLYAFDAVSVPDLAQAETTVTLTSGEVVHLRVGSLSCFAMPLRAPAPSPSPTPTPSPSPAKSP